MIRIRDTFSCRIALLALVVVIAGVGSYQAESQRTACLIATVSAAEDAPIDVNRVRPLMEKLKAGERLTPEEQAYLDRARQQMRSRAGQGPGKASGKAGPAGAGWGTVDTSGLVPLTDLIGTYKGEDGGLYGGGRNALPDAHLAAYLKESGKIQSLDAAGRPAKDGKIGLVTIGFSNTHLESADFKKTADSDPQKSPRVVIVDGAMGMRAAVMWAYDGAEILPKSEQERLDKEMEQLHMPKTGRKGAAGAPDKDTWPTLDQRLKAEALAPEQVQAVWMKHVEAGPRALGDFPAHAKALQADMADILIIAKKRFPNLRVAFLSSRTYGGWAGPNSGSPEPFAYECAFAVRWLIQGQLQGDPQLNYDPARGEVTSPLLLWGPYLWARGDSPRKFDGMVWSEKDVRADDHVHPSEEGCQKITGMLLNFLKSDAGTRRWFVDRPEVRRRQQQATEKNQPGQPSKPGRTLGPVPPARDSTGLIPLTELGTNQYKGQDGGLYGSGSNEPPAGHRAAVEKQLKLVQPRNADGNPANDGKIVFLSVGMSNTTMEFQVFKRKADADPQKSPQVVIVDGAQGARVASVWARGAEGIPPDIKLGKEAAQKVDPWPVVEQRLTDAGISPKQVQTAWIKHAQAGPSQQGEFPKHAEILAENTILTLQRLRQRFPNLRVAYLSSRIYAGYATTALNPEPYAYEGAFAMRWVIQKQIQGDPRLNFDPDQGTVMAPAVLWGPYLWTDGIKPRRPDKLVWLKDDVVPNDRTHPSESGREKVANLLLDFLHNNPLAKCWYLGTSK